jgi:hypothetical protein
LFKGTPRAVPDKNKKKIKDESKKRSRQSLSPARIGAAPFRLIRGAAAVEAAHHAALGYALFGKKES